MMYCKVFENLMSGEDYQSEIKMFIAKVVKDYQDNPSNANRDRIKYLLIEILNAHSHEKDDEKKKFLFRIAQKLDGSIPTLETETRKATPVIN